MCGESFFFFFLISHGLVSLGFDVGRNRSIFALILLDLLSLYNSIPRTMKSSVDVMLVTRFTVNQYSAV